MFLRTSVSTWALFYHLLAEVVVAVLKSLTASASIVRIDACSKCIALDHI